MIVGIDIDDTITAHPEFFSFLSHALIDGGHQVIIITFREDQSRTAKLLDELNIAYSRLITASLEAHMEHGVDEWKGWVCKQHNVEILFEDSAEVLRYIDPATMSFMAVDHKRHDLNALVKPGSSF